MTSLSCSVSLFFCCVALCYAPKSILAQQFRATNQDLEIHIAEPTQLTWTGDIPSDANVYADIETEQATELGPFSIITPVSINREGDTTTITITVETLELGELRFPALQFRVTAGTNGSANDESWETQPVRLRCVSVLKPGDDPEILRLSEPMEVNEIPSRSSGWFNIWAGLTATLLLLATIAAWVLFLRRRRQTSIDIFLWAATELDQLRNAFSTKSITPQAAADWASKIIDRAERAHAQTSLNYASRGIIEAEKIKSQIDEKMERTRFAPDATIQTNEILTLFDDIQSFIDSLQRESRPTSQNSNQTTGATA